MPSATLDTSCPSLHPAEIALRYAPLCLRRCAEIQPDELREIAEILADLGLATLTSVYAEVLDCNRANTFMDKGRTDAPGGMGVPSYSYYSTNNATDCSVLIRLIAVVKEGYADLLYDYDFAKSYSSGAAICTVMSWSHISTYSTTGKVRNLRSELNLHIENHTS